MTTHSSLPVPTEASKNAQADATSSTSVPNQARPNTEQLFELVTPTPYSFTNVASASSTDKIRYYLHQYPDQSLVDTLVGIKIYGARVGFTGQATGLQRPNHPSIHNHMDIIDKYIHEEMAAGRIHELQGPLPLKYFCSPLGLVPKKRDGIQTGWRMIFDLSHPEGRSVNDGIPKQFGTLQYESFQHALRIIAQSGANSQLLKKDLKAVFRRVAISPLDWHLFLFSWRGKYYVDTHLPFGLHTSPRIYNLFAEAIHWVLQHSFGWSLLHYVDDFLEVFPPNSDLTDKSQLFDEICHDFDFPTEPKKDEMGTRVNHLGFEIDTVSMTATLSHNKRERAIKLLFTVITHKTISAKSLETLLGFLSHCCEVIPIGRPFLRHLFNALSKAGSANTTVNPYRYARISWHAKCDSLWWLLFLRHWSCISVIQIKHPFHEIWTDASGSKGIGGIYLSHLFSAHVPRHHRRKHINWKEMYAVLYAFLLWHSNWENGELLVHCDNEAVVEAINKRSIRGPTITPLQTLLLIAALYNIAISAVWIPTASNSIADALSRHDFKRLANLGHQHDHHIRRTEPPTPITTLRQKLLSSLKTASQNLLAKDMTMPSTIISLSQNPTATANLSLPPSDQSPTGLPIYSELSKSKRHKHILEQSRITTLSIPTPSSTIPSSNEYLKVGNESTNKTQPAENVYHSQKTSLSNLSLTYEATTSTTIQSTSTQHSVSVLLDSCVQASSPGINGILFHLFDFVYPASTSHSTSNKVRLRSSSHRQKQILSAKGRRFTSHLQAQKSVQSQHSTISSNDSQPTAILPSSIAPPAPSHALISSIESKQHLSKSVLTQPSTPVILYAKVQQSQLAEKDYQNPIFNNWVDGKATQSTSILTRFQNLIDSGKC